MVEPNNKTWITAETLNIIDERRKIKDKILETPVGEHLNNLRDVYKEFDKQARNQCEETRGNIQKIWRRKLKKQLKRTT